MGGGDLLPVGSLNSEKMALIRRRLAEKGLSIPDEQQSVPRRAGTGPAPLSFSQEALWFMDRLNPGKSNYNIPCAVRIVGKLDVSALERGLAAIVQRHDVLRAVVVQGTDAVPTQVVAPAGQFRLELEDLTELATEAREAELRRRALEYGQVPLDLTRDPLFAAVLIQVGELEHALLLRIHQFVIDGWSFGVFTRELEANYDAFRRGLPSPMPPLQLQFADYAAWERERLTGPALEPLLKYWRSQFEGGVPVLRLPTDRPRPPVQTFKGAHYPVRLGSSLSEELRKFSRREGVTLFVTMLSALKVLLHRYAGQEDIVVGSAFANRRRRELEDLMGFFVTVLPLLTRVSKELGFRELLAKVHEVVLGAAAHQELPLPRMVQEFEGARDPSRNPLYQVVFYVLTPDRNPSVYGFGLSAVGKSERMSGLTLTPIETECGVSRFDIQILIWDLPEGLSGTVEYSTDLFDEATIALMVELFELVLRQVVRQPQLTVGKLAKRLDQEEVRRRELTQAATTQRVHEKLRSLKGRARQPQKRLQA